MNPNTKYTRDELCAILDEAIQVYPNSRYIEMYALLHTRGIYRQMLNYYINTEPHAPIIERVKLLRELQEIKIADGLLNTDSNINTVGALFVLKCKYGYIEKDKKEKLEIDRLRLEKESSVIDTIGDALSVNFSIAQHRTDSEIQRLIDDSDTQV